MTTTDKDREEARKMLEVCRRCSDLESILSEIARIRDDAAEKAVREERERCAETIKILHDAIGSLHEQRKMVSDGISSCRDDAIKKILAAIAILAPEPAIEPPITDPDPRDLNAFRIRAAEGATEPRTCETCRHYKAREHGEDDYTCLECDESGDGWQSKASPRPGSAEDVETIESAIGEAHKLLADIIRTVQTHRDDRIMDVKHNLREAILALRRIAGKLG